MTTPLWESTLFGGWAVMRTKNPISNGVLRPLAIVSVSSLRLNVSARDRTEYLLSADFGEPRFLAVTGVQAHVRGESPDSFVTMTGWEATWNVFWYHQVIRAMQHVQCDESLPQADTDRWSSPWQSFPFQVQARVAAWKSVIHFSERESESPLTIWLALRRRLIKAHRPPSFAPPASPSQEVSKFFYLLGLGQAFFTKSNSESQQLSS
ncbi:MAG: hypothetical protein WCD86_00165, partial [Ktedonobacteraceae bacterium]